ncbi:hypothetical protein QYF61_002020 [Mycteria americana]|uniref:Cadherin domain-containing protein n=1 Tax=Mycteria americana TaxID=33587 RepID=A0AAN7NQC6_MYCAM|nr:hypothetical protein QYF61_002020 [Mycteria americana]
MMPRASMILQRIKEIPRRANRKHCYLRLDYEKPLRRGGAELHCISLVLLQELDSERQPSYTLELVAKDGSMATVHIPILDTNDNSPAFAQSSSSVMVELPEDVLPSSLLLNPDTADPKEGPNAPDQSSVKDSGRGDSEFNDSHSDISGERLKKPPSEMMKNQKPLGVYSPLMGKQVTNKSEKGKAGNVHKKLGGGTARIVDPNWPKGYSIPYDVMMSKNWAGWPGGVWLLLGNWLGISQQVKRCPADMKIACAPLKWTEKKHPGPKDFIDEPDTAKEKYVPSDSIFDNLSPAATSLSVVAHEQVEEDESSLTLTQLLPVFSLGLWSTRWTTLQRHGIKPVTARESESKQGRIGEVSDFITEVISASREDTIRLLRGKGTLLAHVQLGVRQDPQVLFCHAALQLRCPSLDTLQHLNVSLVVRGPKLNTVFEVWPHQCRVEGHDHFPSPAGHDISDTSQNAIGFLGHLGTLLAHIQAAVNQHPQVLLCQAAFQPLFPKPVALHGVAVAQVQDLALGLVEPRTIDLGPWIQPVQVPLQSLPPLKQINTPTQLGVICKLTEGALDPFVQIIDKDVKQNWPQHRALGNTSCDRLPTGVNSIHHHSLGPAVQPVLYPAKSTPVQAMSSQFLQENAITSAHRKEWILQVSVLSYEGIRPYGTKTSYALCQNCGECVTPRGMWIEETKPGTSSSIQSHQSNLGKPQGEEKVFGSDDKMTGTAGIPNPATGTAAAAPTLATGTEVTPTLVACTADSLTPPTGTAAEPKNQPVPVPATPIHKKKYTRKSACLVGDEDEPGPPGEEEEEEAEPINEMVTTRSLSPSLSELRDMRKDFSRCPGEHIVTWLLRRWNNGASSLELEGRGTKLRSFSREGVIDKAIGKEAQALSLWRQFLSGTRERYPFKEDIICYPDK